MKQLRQLALISLLLISTPLLAKWDAKTIAERLAQTTKAIQTAGTRQIFWTELQGFNSWAGNSQVQPEQSRHFGLITTNAALNSAVEPLPAFLRTNQPNDITEDENTTLITFLRYLYHELPAAIDNSRGKDVQDLVKGRATGAPKGFLDDFLGWRQDAYDAVDTAGITGERDAAKQSAAAAEAARAAAEAKAEEASKLAEAKAAAEEAANKRAQQAVKKAEAAQKALDGATTEQARLKAEAAAEKAAKERAQAEAAAEKAARARADADKAAADAEAALAKAERDKAHADLKEAQEKANKALASAKTAQESAEVLQKYQAEVEQYQIEMDAYVANLEAEKKSAEQGWQAWYDEANSKDARIAELEAALTAHNATKGTLTLAQGQTSELESKIRQLEAKLQTALAGSQADQRSIAMLQKERDEALSKLSGNHALHQNLATDVAAVQLKLKEYRSKAEAEIAYLKAQNAQLQEELDSLRNAAQVHQDEAPVATKTKKAPSYSDQQSYMRSTESSRNRNAETNKQLVGTGRIARNVQGAN